MIAGERIDIGRAIEGAIVAGQVIGTIGMGRMILRFGGSSSWESWESWVSRASPWSAVWRRG